MEMEYSFARSEYDWKIRQEQQKRTEFREKHDGSLKAVKKRSKNIEANIGN